MSGLDHDLRIALGRHVRELRQAQGLTLTALAAQIEVSPSALSQIERGKSEPSLGTLWRLGQALKASLFDFFSTDAQTDVDVTRADERTLVDFGRFRYEAITRNPRRTIDLFLLRLEPGEGPVREVVAHAGEEAGLVLEGSLDVHVAGAIHRLGPGDGIWFKSTQQHTFVAVGDLPSVSVWADTIPEAGGDGDGWSRSLFDADALLGESASPNGGAPA